MSIKFLTNNVWAKAAELRYSDGTTKLNDQSDHFNIIGGQTYLDYTLASSATAFNVDYISKDGDLDYDTIVIARADRLIGENVKITAFDAYAGSSFDHLSAASFAETLYGTNSDIYVLDTIADGVGEQGLRLQINSASANLKINKFYGCKSVELSYFVSVTRENLARKTTILKNGQVYQVEEALTLVFPFVSDAEIDSLNELYRLKTDLFFIWDTDGSFLNERIIPVILATNQITKSGYSSLNKFAISVYRVKEFTS